MLLPPKPAQSGPFNLTNTVNNLTPSNPGEFGHAVAISGDNIMVGARGSDIAGILNAGAYYLLN